MLEELDLAEALFGFFEGFVGPAHIAAFTGENLITRFGFDDHGGSPFAEFPRFEDGRRGRGSQ